MTQVYEKHLWGGVEHDFYSGEGSHDLCLINPYVEKVCDFLTEHPKPLSVCDLGCGDFNVGQQLIPFVSEYVGIDIVEPLVARNKSMFQIPNVDFKGLDIAKDELPCADVALVRQVLQHLSNAEISQVVKKLPQYKFVILTEHIPADPFIPNQDIISGQGIRLKKQSGVRLTEDPFNLKPKKVEQLLSQIPANGKGLIQTLLFHF